MKRYGFINFAMAASLSVASVYGEEAPIFIENVRPLGMGGAFTAIADDSNVFSYNPAGMIQRTGMEFTLIEAAVGGSEDLSEMKDFIDAHKDDFENYEDLPPSEAAAFLDEVEGLVGLEPRADLNATIASFLSGPIAERNYIGLGLFGHADVSMHVTIQPDPDLANQDAPFIDYVVNQDILLPLSYARRWEAPGRIPGNWGLGFTGKFVSRSQIIQEPISTADLEDLETPPMATGNGIGMDLGFMYQPTDRMNFGVMVQDLGGTKIKFDALDAEDGYPAQAERETVIKPHTNIGLALFPQKLLWLLPTGNRLTLAADVRDVFADSQKPFGDDFDTHFYAGAELRYWFLRFRAGAYQMHPTFGLGLDIPFVKVDYAYFSRELGEDSGDNQQKTHMISAAIRFGSGNTQARQRIEGEKQPKN